MSETPPIATRIERMRVADLKLLAINARYLRHETFTQLVENVRRDGGLTSVPFAAREPDGSYLVLSGNHRVKAAIAAGFEEIDVMVTDDEVPEQRRLAIQLSHNAITGEDDPATLKALYEQIESIDWRQYAGLDDATLELLQQVDVGALSDVSLEYQLMTIAFLPNEVQAMQEAWTEIAALATGIIDLARFEDYDRLMRALTEARKSHDVHNTAMSLWILLEVFDRHREDLREGWLDEEADTLRHEKWVPLSSVIGTDLIPAGAAQQLNRAIGRMEKAGDVGPKNRWQALELLAADWLAGPDE